MKYACLSFLGRCFNKKKTKDLHKEMNMKSLCTNVKKEIILSFKFNRSFIFIVCRNKFHDALFLLCFLLHF